MALEDPRGAEKFLRIFPVAIKSASKAMVGLERGGFWRGNGKFRYENTPHAWYAASKVKQVGGQGCPGSRGSKREMKREQ